MTLNNLKNEATQIRLSESEKAVMHANIFGTPSPVQVTKSQYVTVSHYSWFSARFVTAMAAFLIVMLGGSTVYASQAALPGDVLYTVKVGVAEPVRAALAFSSKAKLSVHTEIAEERLEEAQELAAEGRLSADAALQIETSLEAHVQEVEALALKVEEVNPDVAGEVSATLESALAINSAILASLGDESDDSDTKKNSHSIASKAQSRITVAYARTAGGIGGAAEAMIMMVPGAVAEDPNALMASDTSADTSIAAKFAPTLAPQAAATATEAQIRAAGQMEMRAENAISEIKQYFAKNKDALSSTAARITLEINGFDERMKTGAELKSMGDYAGAKDLYFLVYKDATALSTFIKAEQKFNKKILNTLINERFGVRTLDIKVEANGELEVEKGERAADDHTTGEIRGTTSSGLGGDDDHEDDKTDSDSQSSDLPINIDLGL